MIEVERWVVRSREENTAILFYFLCVDSREKEGDIDLFYLPMHSLVESCMCPDWGSNPQPWYVGMML